jgi:hypothetical protein
VDKETIFELNKLILDQTNDLWLIASGLITFETLLIAHIIYSLRVNFRESVVAWFISVSVFFHALSLMFGYFAKGALIKMMIGYSTSGTWTFDWIAAWMNLFQMLSVTTGLVIFVVAFAFYSRTLARAMVLGGKK